MLNETVETMAIERLCRKKFALDVSLERIVAHEVPVLKGARATVFEDEKHDVYALCMSEDQLDFADIKAIIRGMGMEAAEFLPPQGQTNYFLHYGRQNFYAVYPGRKLLHDNETAFYQTLAPYNPALVRLARVKGEIREYNPALQRWQPYKQYSYIRMQVS